MARASMACGGAIILVILNLFLPDLLGGGQALLMLLCGLLLVLRYTEVLINNQVETYRNNIRKALPDVLDLMTMCFESGYSSEHALDKIAKEFVDVFPEISNELNITSQELRMLPDRIQAWKNLASRTNLSELNAVASTFSQSEKYGTSVSKSLKTQIELFRKNRLILAEKKAARVPVLLAVPLTLFFVPILFVIILSPAVINIMSIM